MKFAPIALAVAMIAAPAAADTLTYNSAPADGWFFGGSNNYSPANTAVLETDNGDQMYMRFHRTFQPAPASAGATYSFALGTNPLSFDWGIDNNTASSFTASLTLRNIGAGQTFTYDPFGPNDNANANGSAQNSFRFNWVNDGIPGIITAQPGFFTPNMDSTYSVTMQTSGLNGSGDRELTIFAQFGAGAAAVPEPGTWALLILGFGLVGGAMRRKASYAVRYA